MAAPSEVTHDWLLDTFGARLADQKFTQQRAHDIQPIPFLAQQISSTAELTYTDINREVEIAFAQRDFSGGCALATEGVDFQLATSKRVRSSKGADTSFAPYVLPAPKVQTIGAAIPDKPSLAINRGAITYVAAGASLYQVTNATTRTLDTVFATTITDLLDWGGQLIVGLGDVTNFRYRVADAGAFTDAGVPGRFFYASSDLLLRTVTPNNLYTTNQVAGPWAQFTIADSSYPITSLGGIDQIILIGKRDGPYGLDSDYVSVPVAPELRIQQDAQVGAVRIAWNRDYYISSRFGIVRIRPGEGLKNVGLEQLLDAQLPGTPRETRPAAFTTDGRFLYALVVPAATPGIYVWKLDIAGNWHNYLYRTDLGGAGLASSALLFATGQLGATKTNAVLFAYQPTNGNWLLAYGLWSALPDPTQDANYLFEDTVASSFRTLDYTGSYPTIRKYSDRAKVIQDSATNQRYSNLLAHLDDDVQQAAFNIGDFQSSPQPELTLQQSLQHNRLSLEVSLVAAPVGVHPQASPFRAFHVSTTLLPRPVRKHTLQLLAASFMPLASGGRGRGNYTDTIDKLRKFRKDRASLPCRDEDLRKFNAYVDEVTEWTAQPREGQAFPPVKIVTVVLKEIVKDT